MVACTGEKKSEFYNSNLSNGWEMKMAGTGEWFPAEIPGCVHTDLLRNGVIEDPFYRLNEHDLQWIDKEDWVYRTVFSADKKLLEMDEIQLYLPGLDTYAEVFINDQTVLRADNMFREWKVNCKELLKPGDNELKIVFTSPISKGLEKYEALPYTIPVSDNDLSKIGKVPGEKKVSIFTRKAGYHFGWDWGPRFVTSGIWKPVYLQAWNEGMINDIRVIQHDIGDGEAHMTAVIEIKADELSSGEILLYVNDKIAKTRKINADNITMYAEIPFSIEDPQLWWPNGMGEQPLYNIRAELISQGRLIHKKSTRIGLRTIELITTPDEYGNTFHFKVNGRPVFMKGANYIPQDSFLDRVTQEKYAHVVQSAVDANMNMLRIWGGGIYEKDIFYELCDENGILVWQDFMFACSMYPGDTLFLNNVKQEAIDNVKRLRNHPSIALWCGNNENLSAWYRWGWRERAIEEQGQEVADILWKAYQDVFHEILPGVIKAYDSNRYYWASSSSAALGVPDNLTQGDIHYWGVWWGKEPFSSFRENTGRFMSEYGFQSFPEMKTIKQYTIEDDWDIYSDVMKSHQRSSIGNETIELYMERDYIVPDAFEDFIYVGQVLQGEGIKRAIEIHRTAMPYCMGSLYWQINDCWPVASWSGMDYYGRWKAMHYLAKKAFQPVIIVPESDDNRTFVNVVSDKALDFDAVINMRLLDLEGKALWEKSIEHTVRANASTEVFSISNTMLPGKKENTVFEAAISTEEQEIDRRYWYFTSPNQLQLSEPGISFTLNKITNNTYEIELESEYIAKNVFLEFANADGFFSDNYFDMVPGETFYISFEGDGTGVQSEELNITTLFDTYN
ncbi:MAG: glycoside hydrolase family 2 protein [Bacteroidales bacterium]|nr:glycoside hydrolase family 2 protein [Bacteroidales bacterium]